MKLMACDHQFHQWMEIKGFNKLWLKNKDQYKSKSVLIKNKHHSKKSYLIIYFKVLHCKHKQEKNLWSRKNEVNQWHWIAATLVIINVKAQDTVAPTPFLSLPNNWSFRTFLTLTKKFSRAEVFVKWSCVSSFRLEHTSGLAGKILK